MQNFSIQEKEAYINVVEDLTNRSNFEKNLNKKKRTKLEIGTY